jgi:hypothetical protein
MTDAQSEILSAFFDGEPVDADRLAGALRDAGAIDFLVDSARLRRAVADDTSRPTEEFCEQMRATLADGESRWSTRRRVVGIAVAASLALASALGGYGVRSWLAGRESSGTSGPTQAQAPAHPGQAAGTTVTPAPSGPGRTQTPAPARTDVPLPTLRMHFAEWHDAAL